MQEGVEKTYLYIAFIELGPALIFLGDPSERLAPGFC